MSCCCPRSEPVRLVDFGEHLVHPLGRGRVDDTVLDLVCKGGRSHFVLLPIWQGSSPYYFVHGVYRGHFVALGRRWDLDRVGNKKGRCFVGQY